MTSEDKSLIDLKDYLSRQFNIEAKDQSSAPMSEKDYLDFLRNELTQRILFLLDKDFNLLMHSLYKIDVDDALVKKSFNLGDPQKISETLAQYIIERQLKKLSYRYQNQGNSF
jgi:hypothetical protein